MKPRDCKCEVKLHGSHLAKTHRKVKVRTGMVHLSNADTVRLHVIVDSSSIEAFFEDGQIAMSSRI